MKARGDELSALAGGPAAAWPPQILIGAPVVCSDGRAGRVAGVLLGEDAGGEGWRLLVREGRLRRRLRAVPFAWVRGYERGKVRLLVSKAGLAALPEHREDRELERDAREALRRVPGFARNGDHMAIAVRARGGVLELRGNVCLPEAAREAASAVARVAGARGVRAELVCDVDLERRVRRALAQDPRLEAQSVTIRVSLGVVELRGALPCAVARALAVAAAHRVEGVRLLNDLLEVSQRSHLATRGCEGRDANSQPG
jgi:osmotically-inducible protein OsmY